MRRLLLAATAVTAAVLTLGACGTTEPAADKKADAKPAAKISLTDAGGKKVELDGPAKKVVGTEWDVVEHLVSLGVDPVGVADVKGYTAWDKAAPLKGSPKDIGTRGEPSMDTVAALAPDLVVATTDLPPAAVKQLEKIAPVLTLKAADAKDPIGRMTKSLDMIAQATGTTEKGDKLKKDFEAKLATGKQELEKAGHKGTKFAFADGYAQGNQVSVRPFTSGSLIGAVNDRLGLTNPWKVKGDPAYGLGATDVEGLTKLDKDTVFGYVSNDSDKSSTVFTGVLADNAVWKSLPFVTANKVHRLPDGVWMFGGTASMEMYVDSVVTALKK
ncbi:iron-siderophore ABC transporter substrate-binding protein [Streptomyces candidus]|uniref:Iron complex transport system substrate-binding protein n=1 Tax=Streptomyces candidus TaxID=67283 RepID=A0A7X0HKU8_9ACTN|nr:iron-siderophore ABC transporter substrate-binding protein [Streptomyces candidus]MBB6439338.1 iron complex transport system substrate-binding protein [Streptomyces candidus]GHH42303.1 ABC transporter substrate-binding protein [Streptomyces candidus]